MKKIDITEKLDFDSKQCIVIKGREIYVNSDAPTILRVMGMMNGDGSASPEVILKVYELLFTEKGREELDKLKLSFRDLVIVVQEAMTLVNGEDENTER